MKIIEHARNVTAKTFFLLAIVLLISTDIAVALNVPVLREILGFILLTFLPGLLILYILKCGKIEMATGIVLAVGLSVAFAMFLGLTVDRLLFTLGYTTPLSTVSLVLSFSLAILALSTFAYLRNKHTTFSFSGFRLTTQEKAFLIVPSLFPLVSIVGTHIMNLTTNNTLLIALFFIIIAYAIFIAIKHRSVSEKVFPPMIFLISISLLLMLAMKSNHIIGSDTLPEYSLFSSTLRDLHWGITGYTTLDACLSISLLPALYQTWLNIDPEYLFKLLYVIPGSLLPVVVYLLSKRYVGNFYAFLAALLFMSQVQFFVSPTGGRQTMAILFVGLVVLVICHERIVDFPKKTCIIIFIASAIVSHYSTTYILFFALLLTWVGSRLLLQFFSRKTSTTQSKNPIEVGDVPEVDTAGLKVPPFKPSITGILIVLFFTMIFLWYSQLTQLAFNEGVRFIYGTFMNLKDFALQEAMRENIQTALGAQPLTEGVPQYIKFYANWAVVALTSLGLLTTIIRLKSMVSISDSERKKPDFMTRKLDPELLMLALAFFALLILSVALPYVGKGFATSRLDLSAKILLSMFFVIGCITIVRLISRVKYLRAPPYLLTLLVITAYFLCSSGVLYTLYGLPGLTLTLSSEGQYYSMVIHDQEIHSAKWLAQNKQEQTLIWVEFRARLELYGQISRSQMKYLIRTLRRDEKIDGYLYLGYLNVVEGKFRSAHFQRGLGVLFDEYPNLLVGKNKLYANGTSEIYR